MNKTAAFLAFAGLAAVGLIGSVVLAIHRPDATATFTGLIVTVLGLAATAAGTFYALGKQGEKLDDIKTQTNGTLSAEREENRRLVALLMQQHGVSAEQVTQIAPRTSARELVDPPAHRAS